MTETAPTVDPVDPPRPGLAWIPEGRFRMGSDGHYPEEAPVHTVEVDGFWMSRHAVTNDEFPEGKVYEAESRFSE